MSVYPEYEAALRRLFDICAKGGCDTEAAELERQRMNDLWEKLSNEECAKATALSTQLNRHHCECVAKGLPFQQEAV
jgi:hypothetical protein